jgi:biopolymer transport protein ExbB
VRTILLPLLILLAGVIALPERAAATWWNGDWSYRKEITIDAGAGGGNVTSDAGRVPVLVRLHDGNFKFKDAKDDGTDIRFVAADDKTPLNSHIEFYDSVLGMGLIWVDVPDVKAGGSIKILMYYGNGKAPSASDSRAAYDGDQLLVWHFTEKGSPARDWTGYANNATTPFTLDSGSLIGTGARLDGSAGIGVPGSPSLAVAAGGTATITAWVKFDDPQTPQVVYSRGDAASSLVLGVDKGKPYVEITSGGVATRRESGVAVNAGEWHHVAVTAGEQVLLYVDGQPAETLAQHLPALNGPALLGADIRGGGAFKGGIDEFTIAKAARSAGYIRALFASQNANPTLLKYGADEANSGLSGGYFAVILKSVTIDGWVVIGVLIAMMLISWLVMYNRGSHFNAVARSNKAFLEVYRKAGRDPVRFEGMLAGTNTPRITKDEFEEVEDAPMYRLVSTALDELHIRFGGEAGRLPEFHLTDAMVESIKAAVEGTFVLEVQSLNKFMVFLTIAISGGPFVGLLGTVVGVMITFAAIAASGDVNVNSIAPGIAAALVATCFGLFVAIPALFAYNYLLIRLKDEQGKMNTFVEQLITRLAELYEPPHMTTRHTFAAE